MRRCRSSRNLFRLSKNKDVKPQFPDRVLALLRKASGLRIRAGDNEHRFIGIWFVMLKDRVFVRSWSLKPNGWCQTFLKEPSGAIQVAGHEVAVRAVRIRDKRLRDSIDKGYLEKYSTLGALKYAKDLGTAKSRATTMELVAMTAK